MKKLNITQEKKNIIALDIDDVTLDLIPHWIAFYNKETGDNLTINKIKSWDMAAYAAYPDKLYAYLKNRNLYKGISPVSGAIGGINKIRKKGYRVVFATVSTNEQSGVKFNVLKSLKIVESYNDYIEASDKSLILADIIVDDKPDNVVGFSGAGLLFTKPWNKTFKLPRANNWKEVIRQIEYYEKYGHFYL